RRNGTAQEAPGRGHEWQRGSPDTEDTGPGHLGDPQPGAERDPHDLDDDRAELVRDLERRLQRLAPARGPSSARRGRAPLLRLPLLRLSLLRLPLLGLALLGLALRAPVGALRLALAVTGPAGLPTARTRLPQRHPAARRARGPLLYSSVAREP